MASSGTRLGASQHPDKAEVQRFRETVNPYSLPCLQGLLNISFLFFSFFFSFKDFSYLRERHEQGGGKKEANSPLSREPNAGLDPKTP